MFVHHTSCVPRIRRALVCSHVALAMAAVHAPRVVSATPTPHIAPDSTCVGDVLDPRLFVNVVERVSRKPVRTVYSAVQARSLLRDHTWDPATASESRAQSPERSREVSENSRLDVQFDRDWLRKCGAGRFAGALSMSAKVIRGSKTQPIEVPGYSQIGKDSSPALVLRIDNGTDVASALTEISRLPVEFASARTARVIASARDAKNATLTTQLNALSGQLDSIERRRSEQASLTVALRRTADSLASDRARGADADSAQRVRARTPAILDSLARSVDYLTSLQARSEQIARELGDVRAQAARIVTTANAQTVDSVRADAEVLSAMAPDIAAAFRRLKAAANGNGYALASALTQRSVAFTTEEADALLGMVSSLPASITAYSKTTGAEHDAARMELGRTVARVLESLKALTLDPRELPQALPRLLEVGITTLRDAEIVLPASGISSGDVLELTITNTTGKNDPARVLTVRVRARDFGSVVALRDAALLIRRLHATDAVVQREIAAALTADKTKPVTTQDPVNYQASPGAALQFAYVPREGRFVKSFVRWLQPSAGLLIAAPQFSETVTNLDENEKLVTKANKRALDIGTGVIAGFFGDKISLSYGRVLTAPSKKSFYAVGFSFVSLANGVLGLAKAEQ
jgi:hypothetical protein